MGRLGAQGAQNEGNTEDRRPLPFPAESDRSSPQVSGRHGLVLPNWRYESPRREAFLADQSSGAGK